MNVRVFEFIGFSIYILHSFFIFHFAIPLLKYPTKRKIIFFIVPVINTFVFAFVYYLGLPFFALYIASYVVYFVTFKLVSKAPFRQILFGTSSYLINLASIHLLVLIITGAVLNMTLVEMYDNHSLFFQTLSITYLILIGVLELAKKYLSAAKLLEVSTAKIYSEIMGGTSSFLFFVVLLDSWVLANNPHTVEFFLSSVITILFVLLMYYSLFFFNTFIMVLHPYKRKADEAVTLHGQVIKKKLATEYKLYTDDLTKLYNRRFIYRKIDELCESSDNNFGLIYADLAGLKSVNDTFGHKVGDRYLIDIANIVRATIREDDFSARVGGDEFVVILTDVTDEILQSIINRMQHLIKEHDEKEIFTVHANLGYKYFAMGEKKKTRTEVLDIVDNLMKKDKEFYYRKRRT